MRTRFKGGPWDGAEFDVPVCPHVIHFRTLDTASERIEGLRFKMKWAKREHHQYLFDGAKLIEGVELVVGVNISREPEEGEDPVYLADDSIVVMEYRYAPGEPAWWEK
ncbi:MAG: hypothetical protein ACYC3I_01730 [Gemmataceae bacterium]